jgi:hypothetical protein
MRRVDVGRGLNQGISMAWRSSVFNADRTYSNRQGWPARVVNHLALCLATGCRTDPDY